MNVKIQGSGNGTYANTGSCVAVTNYLQHEDLERMKKGEEVQPFFNQFRDYVSAREVTFKIDNNKAKLSRTDAKFYVITVSPSEKELRCMGRTPQECAEALRRYIPKVKIPQRKPRRRLVIICFLSVIYHLYLGIKNRSLVYGTDRTFQYVRVCHYNTSVIF